MLQLIETCRKRAAEELHACDMFLSAADAEFLQTYHGVACAASPPYICRFQCTDFTADVTLCVPFLISYKVLAKTLLPITYLNPLPFAIRVHCML